MVAIPDSPQRTMHRMCSSDLGRSRAFYVLTGAAVFLFCITLISLAQNSPQSAAGLFYGDDEPVPAFSFDKFSQQDDGVGHFTSHHSILDANLLKPLADSDEQQAGESLSDIHVPLIVPELSREKNAPPEDVVFGGVKSKYAFATFLVGSDNQELAYEDNHYLLAARILTYQLLHHDKTRLKDRNIPFIIVVTERVPERNRDILRKDGATVIEVPSLSMDWLAPSISAWDHVMTKLRLWEFTQFERIAFIDADTMLTGVPLDDIFDDPAVQEQNTLGIATADQLLEGAPVLPATYAFAGNAEYNHDHEFPPSLLNGAWANAEYLNAGFFVMKPDLQLLRYYIHYLNTPDSFDSALPEQNLLNHVHQRNGNMPWSQLDATYNAHYPTMSDIENGAKTIHEKWWYPDHSPLRAYMESWRWRMEGYYEAWHQLQ